MLELRQTSKPLVILLWQGVFLSLLHFPRRLAQDLVVVLMDRAMKNYIQSP